MELENHNKESIERWSKVKKVFLYSFLFYSMTIFMYVLKGGINFDSIIGI